VTPRSRQIESWPGALPYSIRRPATRLRIPTCIFARPAAADKEATHTPVARALIPTPRYQSRQGSSQLLADRPTGPPGWVAASAVSVEEVFQHGSHHVRIDHVPLPR